MATWSVGKSLQGKMGAMLRYGTNPPTAADGNDGDSWIVTTTGRLYAVKDGGQWPTTYATLAAAPGKDGAAGAQFTFGTATPGALYGAVGDVYLKTTDYTIYNKVSTGWQSLGSLKGATGDPGAASTVPGPQGAPGSIIYTITGAPSSTNPSTQKDGDYAFQTDAAAGPTFFGPRSNGTFPSSGTSLRGLQGLKGDRGDVGQTGPTPPGAYSGTGAPSSTNPGGAITAGSSYIQTDTVPNRLFVPYSGTAWPTSYVAMGGGSFLRGNGPPAAALGAVGDCYIDDQNSFFYTAKSATTGWTSTPINMVGPSGPSMQVQPTFGQFGQSWGPSAIMNNVTVSSTATGAQVMGLPGAVQYHTPNTTSAFVGGTIVNFSNSTGTLRFALTNNTTNQELYSISIARGTVQNLTNLGTTAYPMVAGNQYVWNVTGSGSAYCNIMPLYLTPSSYGGSVGTAQPVVLLAKALSTTAVVMSPPGLTDQTSYYVNPFSSYLFNVQSVATSSNGGTIQYQLFNSTANAVVWTSPVITASSTGTQYNSANFGINAAYMPVNSTLFWRAVGSGTVTASLTPTVAQ